MTHPATIEALIGLRTKHVSRGDAQAANARELYRRAAAARATAADHLAQAADFSEILRNVDRESADDYPDPRTPADGVVTELRAIADLIEQIGLPEAGLGAGIQLNIHRVTPDAGEAFAAAVAETLEDPRVTRRTNFIEVEYNATTPGVDVEYALYLTPPAPESRPAAARLTPTEVADAFEKSAEYGRAFDASSRSLIAATNAAPSQVFPTSDEVEAFRPGGIIILSPQGFAEGEIAPVTDPGAIERAALIRQHAAELAEQDRVADPDAIEEHAHDVAHAEGCASYESDEVTGETYPCDCGEAVRVLDQFARLLDQADQDAEPVDQAPAYAGDYVPVEGLRVKVVRGQHRGRFGRVTGDSGNFWRYIALEGDPADNFVETVRVATSSITPAPLDAEA